MTKRVFYDKDYPTDARVTVERNDIGVWIEIASRERGERNFTRLAVRLGVQDTKRLRRKLCPTTK